MATRNPTTITAPQDVGAFMAGTALAFDAEAVPSADPQRRAAALQAHAQQGQRNTMEAT